MGLSDAEIETRLALLRQRRAELDREIADLVLYLELGRRLAAGTPSDPGDPGTRPERGSGPTLAPLPRGRDAPPAGRGDPPPRSASPARRVPAALARPEVEVCFAPQSQEPQEPQEPEVSGALGAIPPAISFAEDAAGARRYGRALVEAARAAIAEAGRPLHAAEILAVLVGQGFSVPGRDPVAALNTRLWKRAGPDGPLRRVGEATYALAAPA